MSRGSVLFGKQKKKDFGKQESAFRLAKKRGIIDAYCRVFGGFCAMLRLRDGAASFPKRSAEACVRVIAFPPADLRRPAPGACATAPPRRRAERSRVTVEAAWRVASQRRHR